MIKLKDISEEWSDKYKRSIDCDNPKGFSQKAHCQGKKKKESVNELMLARDVDSKMKELGISKIPISSQGENVLKGMVKEKFLDNVTNKERLIYFVESLGKEKFGYGSKGKPLSPLVDRFWNDISSEAIYFGGKMAAYQVAMNIKDMKRNGEEIDSSYEMMKEYFKNFGINHSGSRVFDSALRNLGEWMKRNKIEESVNEAGLKGTENIPSNKKLSQLSDNEKLNIIQSLGNIISFHIPDWAKGRYKFWQVISAGKIKKKKDLDGEIIYFLPGKGPQKASPTYKSVKDLINGVDWDTMEMKRESVNESVKEMKLTKEQIIDAIMEGVDDPGILKCVFMAGGPGSGKSYTAKEIFGVGKGLTSTFAASGLKVVNSDSAFEKGLKDNGIDPKDLGKIEKENPELWDKITGKDSIRSKAKALTQTQQSFYEAGRLGMIIDGTGDDFVKMKKKVQHAKSLGYDCYMVFVNTSLEVALERNRKRERTLSDELVTTIWKDCQENLGKFQGLFGGNMVIVDNTVYKPINKLVQKAVDAFIRKPIYNPIGKKWITTARALKSAKLIKSGKEVDNKPTIEEKVNLFFEENIPTKPDKWAYAVSQAKQKFDVYPSAYANAWASKKYKELGGGWRKSKKESVEEVTTNDWHFKAIKKLWDKAGDFTKKKIASVITKNPKSTWDKIEKELRVSDYDEVTYFTDMLHLESVTESSNDKQKVVDYLVKKGNNKNDAQKMVDKNYDYVSKKYNGASVSKKAEIISSLH